MTRVYELHLVSDSTCETLSTVAKAVCVQFEGAEPREHIYPLVRSERQLQKAVETIATDPGVVLFTLVNLELRQSLQTACAHLNMPCVSILDAASEMMAKFLGTEESHRPGGQHEMDSRYLDRVEAVDFAIRHDDGQSTQDIDQADVILVGASRTSKTPTCVYLAIRGVRAANFPIVPGVELPEEIFSLTKPLIVGLWTSPDRLLQVRRNRLVTMGETKSTDYVDDESVRSELAYARRLFEKHDWPTLDVSRRSIEETAASIMALLAERQKT